ncbi:MAG: hypothetical protein J6S28_02765 [Clostridia bacterium]|nr:hypothetical protein [Clostridia bacterium]MBO7296301.1 hypothetical protein [Clostridia bacterium]
MNWKKLGKALLFPHMAVMILLVPLATVFLVWSMMFLGTQSPVAIASYVTAAYTLTVWCFKIPYLIRFFKTFKQQNKLAKRWQEDARLRMNVSLYGTFAYNALYGVFQIWLGLRHETFWFLSLGAYYICLAVMRLVLLLHTGRYAPGERMRTELKKYRATGTVFLIMNLALALMVFFMVYWNRTFEHHMITAIAMAAYTFLSFTLAILNVIKYKKYQSPVFSAAKAISFASACVSMLTLTSTMLTTFQDGSMDASTQKLMLGCVGAAVVAIVTYIAIYMIVHSTKKLKEEVKNGE